MTEIIVINISRILPTENGCYSQFSESGIICQVGMLVGKVANHKGVNDSKKVFIVEKLEKNMWIFKNFFRGASRHLCFVVKFSYGIYSKIQDDFRRDWRASLL